MRKLIVLEYVLDAEADRVKAEFGQILKMPATDREVLSVVRHAQP